MNGLKGHFCPRQRPSGVEGVRQPWDDGDASESLEGGKIGDVWLGDLAGPPKEVRPE